jgi:8-oxo-dGTP diphosphatase
MDDVAFLRADPDVAVRHERVPVDAESVERIRANLRRGVEAWVSTAVVDDADRVLLVRNAWSDGWVPPGGNVEPSEGLREAAIREVREETGVEVLVHAPVAIVEETFACGERTASGTRVAFAASAATTDLAADPGLDGEGIEAARWFGSLPARLEQRDLVELGRDRLP